MVMIEVTKDLILEVAAKQTDVKYQWFKDGNAINGANTAKYQSTMKLEDKGVYYCQITNDCGIVNSKSVIIIPIVKTSDVAGLNAESINLNIIPNPAKNWAKISFNLFEK